MANIENKRGCNHEHAHGCQPTVVFVGTGGLDDLRSFLNEMGLPLPPQLFARVYTDELKEYLADPTTMSTERRTSFYNLMLDQGTFADMAQVTGKLMEMLVQKHTVLTRGEIAFLIKQVKNGMDAQVIMAETGASPPVDNGCGGDHAVVISPGSVRTDSVLDDAKIESLIDIHGCTDKVTESELNWRASGVKEELVTIQDVQYTVRYDSTEIRGRRVNKVAQKLFGTQLRELVTDAVTGKVWMRRVDNDLIRKDALMAMIKNAMTTPLPVPSFKTLLDKVD